MTRAFDDGRNFVDDYLKRRGWKESASNKAYMTALRSSVMSLYEISDIVRDESFLARDLIRGGEPVRVSERSGTRYLKPWDRLAARLVRIGSRTEMAGGALPFDYETSEIVLKALRDAGKKARVQAGKFTRKLGQARQHAGHRGSVRYRDAACLGIPVHKYLARRSAATHTKSDSAPDVQHRRRRACIHHGQLPTRARGKR